MTENLEDELRVFDAATISTDGLISGFCLANITLVLNLDEIDVCYEAYHFYDVSHYRVIGNGFDQLNLCTSLEIINLVFDLSNHNHSLWGILCLYIDVYAIGHFPQRILHKQDLVLENQLLQVKVHRMLHKQAYSTLIIDTLDVNLRVFHVFIVLLHALLVHLKH